MKKLIDFVGEYFAPQKEIYSAVYAVVTSFIVPLKNVKCNHRFRCRDYKLAKEERLWELLAPLCNKHADNCVKYQKFEDERQAVTEVRKKSRDITTEHFIMGLKAGYRTRP